MITEYNDRMLGAFSVFLVQLPFFVVTGALVRQKWRRR
jgi:hypothetical protein